MKTVSKDDEYEINNGASGTKDAVQRGTIVAGTTCMTRGKRNMKDNKTRDERTECGGQKISKTAP
jgi:hypothetical protein